MPVQNDKTGDRSLLQYLKSYCKTELHLINRIDRPVSGLVLLTKNSKAHENLIHQQSSGTFLKSYIALVEKGEIPDQGILQNFLQKDGRQKKSHINSEQQGNLCELEYKVIHQLDRYLILEVLIRSGKFHQIRAQLAYAGVPVKADVKYGAKRGNPDRSIGLHAWKYQFKHPSSGEAMLFEAQLPTNDLWPIVQQKIIDHV
ncbi:MAG: RNA pseudouridine synthase [Saprospiraceae bacterium]|nr:RNA pseudouridine synthase [Saprospiraceae bacterium]